MAKEDVIKITPAENKTIMSLRADVVAMGNKLSTIRESARDLAPRIMKSYNTLAAKYTGLDFVGYARLFDATVPTHGPAKEGKPGYLVHKVYMALDYMRRIQRTTNRPRTGQGRIDPATDQLARTIKTILQLVKDPAPVWLALKDELGMQERQISRLKTRVDAAKPLLGFKVKPMDVSDKDIVHDAPKGPNTTASSKAA